MIGQSNRFNSKEEKKNRGKYKQNAIVKDMPNIYRGKKAQQNY